MTDGRLAENFYPRRLNPALAEKRAAQYASSQRNFVGIL